MPELRRTLEINCQALTSQVTEHLREAKFLRDRPARTTAWSSLVRSETDGSYYGSDRDQQILRGGYERGRPRDGVIGSDNSLLSGGAWPGVAPSAASCTPSAI